MFRRLPSARTPNVVVPFVYPAGMSPLVTALLDADLEREGRATAVLVEGFEYEYVPTREIVRVPCGYYTDFASIPWYVRWAIQPFGRHSRAAVLHDWLYALGEPGRRDFADLTLMRAMKELKVRWLQRQLIYLAVRTFGAGAYGHPNEYDNSWADWRTGAAVKPKHPATDFYNGAWPDIGGELSNCCSGKGAENEPLERSL